MPSCNLILLVLALSFPSSLSATVYKCADSSGKVTYSQIQCSNDAKKLQVQEYSVSREERLWRERSIKSAIAEARRIKYIESRKMIFYKIAKDNRELYSYLEKIKLWEETYKQGLSTPRLALSQILGRLGEIKNDIFFLDIPRCYIESRKILMMAISEYYDGLSEFMQNRGNIGKALSEIHSSAGDDLMEKFWKSMPDDCSA